LNLYFLLEGRVTEPTLYRTWIREIAPSLTEVKGAYEAHQNNYFLLSGGGYPYILQEGLDRAIEEVNEHGLYDYLAICLDADEVSVDERNIEITNAIIDRGLTPSIEILRVIQHRCIETWLLGNRRICQPPFMDSRLQNYVNHYNVRDDDPELMPILAPFTRHSDFHFDYLRKLIGQQNPNRIGYSKRNPGHTSEPAFLERLIARTTDFPTHLRSFQKLIEILRNAENASHL
jgi:hypothetical protein